LKILLVGKTGQVGRELTRTLAPIGELAAVARGQIDLAKPASIRTAVEAAKANVIVNAAAYTAVDRAEKEESAAFAVNRDGPAVLAEEARKAGALLVHFSTDYVFDGEKLSPYLETDATHPLNVYGRSKLAGEEAIRSAGCRHLIFRTSWVYSDAGNNFLLTMLRLGKGTTPLRVVNDQFGAPTSSLMIADALPHAVRRAAATESLCGTYHLSAAGRTTWHGFASALLQASGIDLEVVPIASKDYNAPARRPRNSLLDNSKIAGVMDIHLPPWQDGMAEVLQRLKRARTR
jgi:dTDP-4-dehydrorhamnose reductase